jgi:hypothetical protein
MVAPSKIKDSVIAGEVTVRASAITQPKGHTPFLIFRYLPLTNLDFGDSFIFCRPSTANLLKEPSLLHAVLVVRPSSVHPRQRR